MIRAYSIRWQLMLICMIIVTIPVISLGIFTIKYSTIEINQFVEKSLKEQSLMITNNIKTAVDINQKRVNSYLNIAHDILYFMGNPLIDLKENIKFKIVNQITKEDKLKDIPVMKINRSKVIFSSDIVDKIQKLLGSGTTVTIFQMIPEGALRIATNVLNSDGSRAVGTYIPTDSPVYKAVSQDRNFYGRAFVVKKWCQTAYEPIKDDKGNIIGMLYVGTEDASESILDGLSKMVIGKTGYVYILNEKGDYVLSYKRQRDGENIISAKDATGNEFIKEIINKGIKLKNAEAYISYYPWQNKGESSARMKIAGCAYLYDWKWIVAASTYIDDFYDVIQQTKLVTFFIAITAIIAGTIIGFFFTSAISKPIKKLQKIISLVSDGDLSQEIIDKSRFKELNDISTHFNAMIESIRNTVKIAEQIAMGDLTLEVKIRSKKDTLGKTLKIMIDKLSNIVFEIRSSAEKLTAGAENMSLTSQVMNNGAVQQTNNIEEVTSAMNQMVAQVQQNASNSSSANRLAEEAKQLTDKANILMNCMVNAMKEINSSSQNISKIIKVIDEMSFQTNLLALNASVEAARAGKHGKGFAVVAGEVRNLANRSTKSAKETYILIDETVKKIDEGTNFVNQTAKALNEIFISIEKVKNLIEKISIASNEQNQGIMQISKGLNQIENITKDNKNHAAENTSASEELSEQSLILSKLVNSFKL